MKNQAENNKLIAEFMNYPDLGTEGDFSYLKYHTSWDWLMPVVEKIEDLDGYSEYSVEIRQGMCFIENGKYIEAQGDTKIEATYYAVVEFIKWYNKNKED